MAQAFISYSAQDEDLVLALKDLVEDAFVETVEVFVSSDQESLPPGEHWSERIRQAIDNAELFIGVLTPRSISRPWVLYEAGAAAGRKKPFISVCTRGLEIQDVDPPLNLLQLLRVSDDNDARALVQAIAKRLNCNSKINPTKLKRVVALCGVKEDDIPVLAPRARANEPGHMIRMREEYDALGPARQVLWETLEAPCNVAIASDARYPGTLNALVDLAQPLMGLPLPPGENLREYPLRYADRLMGSDRLLYDFSCKVYPSKREGRLLEELSAIERAKFSDFHNPARGALARFWNKWFEVAYAGREIGVDTIVGMFGSQYRLVKLLTYLETALVQWTQDTGMPKQWLFRGARDWTRVTPKS